MKALTVLALMHEDYVPPEDINALTDQEFSHFKTEHDVIQALLKLGHDVQVVGINDDLSAVRDALDTIKPDIVFNLLEEFSGIARYMPFILGYLELRHMPYTGCNPQALMLCDHKSLMRKILRYHRIPMPDFVSFRRGKRVRRPARLDFPLIVKSPTEHGSMGIAQASVVTNDQKLQERVEFVYDQIGSDVIIEEFIEGRELYCAIMGNDRLTAFPVWELILSDLPDSAHKIATSKVKWDVRYQERHRIRAKPAAALPDGVETILPRLTKRVFRILGLNGYARLDFRLTPEGKVYLLEPNPNPDVAQYEEFAESAEAAGINYEPLIQRILNLGLQYKRRES